ncbi:MAG: S8 family serine peptidase [Patescibacteria group bacterium]
MKRLLALSMTLVMLFSMVNVQASTTLNDDKNYTGDLVIKLASGVDLTRFMEENSLTLDQVQLGAGGYVLVHTEEANVQSSQIWRGAESVEQDGQATILTTVPNDYYYVKNGSGYGQWNLKTIGLETVWDTNKCSQEVVVAVIDTGLDYTHPDLQDLMWLNEDEISGNDLDDDDNGYIDDVHGYDFVYDDNDITDDNDHGSAVTSIIGANTNNEIGMAGVCWNTTIMPIKVANANGSASLFNIAQGIYYAVDNGAKVVNLSLGATVDQKNVREAVAYAYDHGVVLVAAAGNSESYGVDIDYLYYPAQYSSVIAVGAVDKNDEVATLSNASFISHRGNELDLVAPGVDVVAALRKDTGSEFAVYEGTSMSVPHVVGAVAMMFNNDNSLTPTQIDDLLASTAEQVSDMTGDFDVRYGHGRLNVKALMQAMGEGEDVDPEPDPEPDPDPDPIDVYGSNYLAQWKQQSNYWVMKPGETRTLWVEIENTGDALWLQNGANAVHLGTDRSMDRGSLFYESGSWLSNNRIAMSSVEVKPGEIARFEFTIKAPNQVGAYREYFRPVAENIAWMNDMGIYWELEVTNSDLYAAAWRDQSEYLNLQVGDQATSWIEFLNTGTATWQKEGNNALHLGTTRPMDRSSYLYDADTWLSVNRMEMDQTTVAPGEVGRFTFDVQPSRTGVFYEYFQPVVENLKWLQDWGVYLKYDVI